uniref:Uncharacterized protein n=1 Tax=Heterorhabditis bacteriophora TaxID=37862 RepID=A0A1I7WL47_HETBA
MSTIGVEVLKYRCTFIHILFLNFSSLLGKKI